MNEEAFRELKAREILFYAQCQLAGMIAENQLRELRGEAPAYMEDHFTTIAEQTRGQFANCL